MRTDKLEIIDFEERYAKDFARLNYQWLEELFEVEEHDREMLDHPATYIIDQGGQIFFVLKKNEVVGTVALIVENDNTLELAKMAVSTELRGQGIGKYLLEYAIQRARQTGKSKLVLESSTKLTNAIKLYENMGFKEVAQSSCSPYHRCDIRMEMDLS